MSTAGALAALAALALAGLASARSAQAEEAEQAAPAPASAPTETPSEFSFSDLSAEQLEVLVHKLERIRQMANDVADAR
jgi:hypothetical protein